MRVGNWTAGSVASVLTAIALLAAGLVLVPTPPVAAQTPTPTPPPAAGTFQPQPTAPGVHLAVFQGGAIQGAAAAIPNATSFWVTAGGQFVGYIRGAPDFVNAAFFAQFPGGQIAPGTPMVVVLGGGAAPVATPIPGATPISTVSPTPIGTPVTTPTPTACVDINTAPIDQLRLIIHIDAVRAPELVSLRPFSSVEDMIRITGIGPARLADIQAQGLACVQRLGR